MTETDARDRLRWLMERLESAEQEIADRDAAISALHDEVADWRTRAHALELAPLAKVAAYESAMRQIVNNPTMKREDVQGRLLTALQDQGAM